MDFLRNNVFFIVCGLLGAGGIALGVMGRQRMPQVEGALKKVADTYTNLDGLTKAPVNLARLEAERQRIETVLEDRKKVLERAKALYGYQPLVAGVFPDGPALKLTEFRDRYHAAMEELLNSLRSGEPASSAEIEAFRDKIRDEQAAGTTTTGGPAETKAGILTAAGVRQDHVARAHIAAAQRIFCYATHWFSERPPERYSTLHIEDALKNRDEINPPDIGGCWRAQLGYWIQKDVVEAIAAINADAEAEATKQNQNPWVGIMPVKDVISIRVSNGYVAEAGGTSYGGAPEGHDPAIPPGTPETVFTHSGSNRTYDVVQFAVKLVMDQRDIPALIERLCKNKFHTLLDVAYQSLQTKPNAKFVGKVYGSEPIVLVVMNFETVMLGEVFRPMIPAAVCEEFGITCPPPEARGAEDDE